MQTALNQASDYFNMFKDFIFKDERLKPIHRFTLLVMRNASNGESREAFMSMTTLSQIIGVARETANRIVTFLKKLGYLVATTTARNKPVHYKVKLNPSQPETEKLSTGVITASHQHPKLIETRCDPVVTPGVITSSHLCDHVITPVCARDHTNLKESNLIKEEFKPTPFSEKKIQTPNPQTKPQPPQTLPASEPREPGYGAQQIHLANAKRLRIAAKTVEETWQQFIARIRIAQKLMFQGGICLVRS